MAHEPGREELHVGGLRPVVGACCVIGSLFTKFPDVMGCQLKGELLCFRQNALCCKTGDEKDESEKCIVNQAKCSIIKPSVLVKGICQVLFLDFRCSLPLDADLPCLINIFGFTCCYWNPSFNFIGQFCLTVADMEKQFGGTKYQSPSKDNKE